MCIKSLLVHLKSILLENAFKRGELLVLALVGLLLQNSMRLDVSQCIHCVKKDNVQKGFFSAE